MRRLLRVTQYFLWALGLGSLTYSGLQIMKAIWSQREGTYEFQRPSVAEERPSSPAKRKLGPIPGSVFGMMEIPRLRLSAVVFEGSDDDTLERGVGHLMESATLDQTGNVVLAGHRDTFFRPLRNIRVGDAIRVRTVSGERSYVVESTKVVTPDDVGVLDATPDPVLTLITCYPFRFIGSAPDRFIVRARETSAESSALRSKRKPGS